LQLQRVQHRIDCVFDAFSSLEVTRFFPVIGMHYCKVVLFESVFSLHWSDTRIEKNRAFGAGLLHLVRSRISPTVFVLY
jgi:hypothetical protein